MKTSRIVLFGLLTLVLISSKCKDKDDENTPENYDRSILLTNVSENFIIPAYDNYKTQTLNLKAAINAFTASPNQTNLSTCQNDLKATMLAWQNVATLEFGPAENIGLRAQTNTYPTDTTQIANNITAGTYNLELPENYDAKGLQALDFLLFKPNFTNSELVNYYVSNSSAKTYLSNISGELNTNATSVYNTWETSYKTIFIANSESNSLGTAISNVINALSLHYEAYVRKGKVGIPLGVFNGVSQQTLPGHVEAYYSGYSKELAIQQMRGIQNLINGNAFIGGTNGEGFDDYLDFVDAKYGEENLSTTIDTQINLIISNLNNLNGSINQDIENNNAAVQTVYQSMQQLVPLIKIEMTAALGVLVSYQDNDGD